MSKKTNKETVEISGKEYYTSSLTENGKTLMENFRGVSLHKTQQAFELQITELALANILDSLSRETENFKEVGKFEGTK